MTRKNYDDLREKAEITEVIGRYIPLIKKGKNYTAVCPLHNDTNPSLSISQEKQIYKCFACGAGGNVFNFVAEYEHIPFQEAVIRIAEMIDYPLDALKIERKTVSPEEQLRYDCMDAYKSYTIYQLDLPENASIKQYLLDRGLTQEQLERFEVGYNPGQELATAYLLAKGFRLDTLIELNLTRLGQQKEYDVFNQRIVFPIKDIQGRVIAFTARALNKNEQAKYINTTETVLYRKGDHLYHADMAQRFARQKQELILVEGVMDVIALDSLGVHNAVAALGTALTHEQVKLMRSLSTDVVLCYDSDEAGQRAMMKNARILRKLQCKISIIPNSSGKELDELAKESKEKASALVLKRQSYYDFFMEYTIKQFDLSNYSQRRQFAELVLGEISEESDAFDRQHVLSRIEELTQFNQDQLKLLIKPNVKAESVHSNISKTRTGQAVKNWAELEILSQMLYHPQAAIDFRTELGFFRNKSYHQLALLIIDTYRDQDSIELADFISLIEDDSIRQIVLDLGESSVYSRQYRKELLMDAVDQVKLNHLEIQINQFKQKHLAELDLLTDETVLKEYERLVLQKQALLSKKGQR